MAYSRKDICFYGEDAYEQMEEFVKKYEDLLETPKRKNYNNIKHYSTYTNCWVLMIWITKENWKKILDTNVIKKHELNTQGNSLVKYSPEI